MKRLLYLFLFSSAGIYCSGANTSLTLKSPDNSQCISVSATKDNGNINILYDVSYKGKNVVKASRMGVETDNRIWELALAERIKRGALWMDNFDVDSISPIKTHIGTWHNDYGERSTVEDNYSYATIYLGKHDGSGYRMNIELRAYNQGIAFRYFFPEHPDFIYYKITRDLTDYTLPEGTKAWVAEWAQAPYDVKDVNDIKEPAEGALTMELPNGVWTSLVEAQSDNWTLTKYISSTERKNTLATWLYGPVDAVTYFASPWKIIINADSPSELLSRNDIIQNVNPSSVIKDANEWIKPGKIMRETTLTTEGAKKTIDFCAKHNMQYMLFDWKWYSDCTSHDGDATKVIPQIDMPEVVRYGKEKGIGIWLYVNQHALKKQSRILFPLLNKWGIAGVKSGFLDYASQYWDNWVHDLVREAADNHLMMNIHDEYRPMGFSRTYPNLLTQEGIRGNEEYPDASHNCTLPFTRMINGAADYTICYYSDKLTKVTHAHQLAASLVFFSPLETLFWYDRPEQSKDEPELEWFDNLTTTFDDTKVIGGYPGKYIEIARKKGDKWWFAILGGNDSSVHTVQLSFLSPKSKYIAHIYADGGSDVKTSTHVRCSTMKVDNRSKMSFTLHKSDGVAIWFEKIK